METKNNLTIELHSKGVFINTDIDKDRLPLLFLFFWDKIAVSISNDDESLKLIADVYKKFTSYMNGKTEPFEEEWIPPSAKDEKPQLTITGVLLLNDDGYKLNLEYDPIINDEKLITEQTTKITKAFFNYTAIVVANGVNESFQRFLFLGVAAGNCYINEIGRPDIGQIGIAPHKATMELVKFLESRK